MKRHHPNRRVPVGWLLAAILAVFLSLDAISCSKDRRHNQAPLLENLPPDLVELLISGDDFALARWGENAGFEKLHMIYADIGSRRYKAWAAGRKNDIHALEAYEERLARVLSDVYKDDSYLAYLAKLRRLTEDERSHLMDLRTSCDSVASDGKIPPKDAIPVLTRYVIQFDSLGDADWAAKAKNDLSDLYAALGDTLQQKRYLLAAATAFQKLGRSKMSCETLGKLGSRYEKWGQPDSMAICYDRALEIAYHHRMGYQAARILEFYGDYYSRLGRLDVKQRLLERAMKFARDYESDCYEIRFAKEAMRFNASLGCWDVVDRLITQVRGLAPACKNLDIALGEVNHIRTDVMEARVEMARGNVARADSIFREVDLRLPGLELPAGYRAEDDEYSYYRAEGLLVNGRPRDALNEVQAKLPYRADRSIPLWSARLSLVAAKAAYRLGAYDETLRRIEDFDRLAVGEESDLRTGLSERDALAGLVALARGDTTAAIEAVSKGLAKLRSSAETIDASVGSYLWLTDSDELRQALHDVVATDDLAGYGAGFCWHGLYELLGASSRMELRSAAERPADADIKTEASSCGTPLLKELRRTGEKSLERVQKLGAAHCAYLVRDGEVWRWTAGRNGVRRDVLPARAEDLQVLVQNTWALLSKYPADQAAVPGADLRMNLRKLARALLPSEVLNAPAAIEPPPLLLVTTDGFLGTIPFEAFDVGSGESYEPLLQRFDLAYLRHARQESQAAARGPGVILVNETSSQGSGARAMKSLPEAKAEGLALHALDPSARLLVKGTATKTALAKLWEDASYVYIAAHAGRTELPYLSALVLAVPKDDVTPDADLLDVTNIRSADLRRCGLIVLSGCSSGLPYIAARGAAPSLGDAFLDAGAGAVVHTFWDVADDDAHRIGTAFVERWKKEKDDEIRALCDARRAEFRGEKGIRHPHFWASYAITVSRL